MSLSLCLDGLLITMHRHFNEADHRDSLTARIRLDAPSISNMVCALLTEQSLHLRREVFFLRDKTRRMTDDMDDDPETVPLKEILAAKRRLLDLDRMADEQMSVFDILKAMDKPQLNLVGLAQDFHLALGNVHAADRRFQRLDREVHDLQDRHESIKQDKINRRLGALTILSAIFLPLTLLAGIYGMNFDFMPELHFRYSYPIAIGVMIVVGGMLFWFFHSRKWLE